VVRWSIAAALVAGALLRNAWLRTQVLAGDEFHALNAALEWPLSQIVSTWTYHGADYGVPMAAGFRLAFDLGATLGEFELRLPAMILGTLSIAVMPWMLRGRLGTAPTILYAWLLASSPLLVIYSRMARSYAPALLLAFVAVVCFERWWSQRSRRAAAAYAICAALALWCNLVVAPFVAAPVVYALVRFSLGDAALRQRRGELFWIAGTALACAALPLVPALGSLEVLDDVHGRGGPPSVETWLEVVRMHAGTRSWIVCGLVLAALTRGVWITWVRDRWWLGYLAAVSLMHMGALLTLGPDQLDNPIVINRYLLVLLPFGLALVARGAAEPIARIPASAQTSAVVAVGLGLIATGPLATRHFAHTSFSTASTFAYFVRGGNEIPFEDMPEFYRELSEADDVQPVLEYPWSNLATHAFDAYQKHHEQPVYVVAPWREIDDERLSLERTFPPRVELYLDSPARWLVVHLDLQQEERRVRTSDRNHWMRLQERPQIWQPLLRAGPTKTRLLERRFGPADHASELLRVWDLDRLRAGR